MNLNHFEAIQLVQKLSYELRNHDYESVEVSVHPPFTNIRSIQIQTYQSLIYMYFHW